MQESHLLPKLGKDGQVLGAQWYRYWRRKHLANGDLPVDSDRILRELIFLRGYDGASFTKVRQKCPGLMNLRVTTIEAERRGLSPKDQHVAAIKVLECGIRNLVPRPDYSRILSRTLNLPFSGSASGLEYRQDLLRLELNLSDKEFRRVQRQAFDDFASRLVLADSSPCADDVEPDRTLRLDIKIEGSAEELAAALNLLTFELRPAIVERVGQEILRALPRARAQVQSGRVAGLEDLVKVVLTELYTADGEVAIDPSKDSRGQSTEIMFYLGESVMTLLGFNGPTRWLTERVDAIYRIELEVRDAVAADIFPREPLGPKFQRIKHRSLARLAELVAKVERADAWEDLLDGSSIPNLDRSPIRD